MNSMSTFEFSQTLRQVVTLATCSLLQMTAKTLTNPFEKSQYYVTKCNQCAQNFKRNRDTDTYSTYITKLEL